MADAYGGGWSRCSNPGPGCGTIFKLTPSGKKYAETILYRFQGPNGNDGQVPSGGVISRAANSLVRPALGGNFSTYDCYYEGCGTVFKLPLSGSGLEKILFAFSGNNGAVVSRGVIDKGGTLVDPTNYEGEYGYGTVFDTLPEGGYAENTLHEFADRNNGGLPLRDHRREWVAIRRDRSGRSAQLRHGIQADAFRQRLHRDHALSFLQAEATVRIRVQALSTSMVLCMARAEAAERTITDIKLTPSGGGYVESTLYPFKGGRDAEGTYSTLTEQAGTIYGTSEHGGLDNYGTVFKLTPSGRGYSESVIYRFKGGTDGSDPYWGVVADKNGTLYSTTATGGPFGNGTVFELAPH